MSAVEPKFYRDRFLKSMIYSVLNSNQEKLYIKQMWQELFLRSNSSRSVQNLSDDEEKEGNGSVHSILSQEFEDLNDDSYK